MKKRIGSILLTICMLMGMLPTAVFAADATGPLVTLEYPEELCTIIVTDRNQSATVENGGRLKLGSNGKASAIFEIENIAKGYRIAKVMLDGKDYTVNFITGSYGGMAMSGISEDTTISVALEKVPELPVLESFEVYTDAACTQVLSTNLTLSEAIQVYVKGNYSDGGAYPEYTARGHMEYTLDGTTWNWTQWGGDYWYFPLNDTFYTAFNPLKDSYDFRICIEPDGLFCTGDTLYSEVYHVNGGASGAAGGSDNNELHQLTAPTNLNWHRFYNYNSNDGSYVDFKSLISWQVTDTEYDQDFRVVVYKDGKEVFTNGWIYRAKRHEIYMNDWDFSLSDYGPGTYKFTVQAMGDDETTKNSAIVESEDWVYTEPNKQLAAPKTAWSTSEPVTATWESSTEALAGGYQIRMYYSPNNANATDTQGLRTVARFVYYTGVDGEQTSFAYDPECEDGYYYFQVRAISADESKARHSQWSDLSPAYAHFVNGSGDSGEIENACTLTFSFEYPEGVNESCNMYAEYTADDNSNVTVYSGGQVPSGSSVDFAIKNIADGYRIKSVTIDDHDGYSGDDDWTEGFVDGGYGFLGLASVTTDMDVYVEFEAVPDPLPSITDIIVYRGYAEDGVVANAVTFGDDYQTQRLTATANFDVENVPGYHGGFNWYYSLDGVNYKIFPTWQGNRDDFWAGWSGHASQGAPFDYVNQQCYYIKVKAIPKQYYSQTGNVWSEPIMINHLSDGVTDCTKTETCTGCGEVIREASEHIWDKGVITTQPTGTAAGIMTYTCQVCKGTKTETIAPVNKLDIPDITVSNRASDGKPTVTWKAVEDATGYEVYYCGTSKGSYKLLYTAKADKLNVTHTGAVVGNDYFYKVRAIRGNEQGEFSAAKGVWCDLTRPTITVTNRASDGKPTISWKAVEGATGYEVYRCGTSTGDYVKMYTAAADKLSVTHTGAVVGNDYFYKVKALYGGNSKCDSADSSAKGVWCDLKQPTITVTNRASDGKPTISWKAVEGATGYEVYRCGTSTGDYVKMYTAAADKLSVTHIGAVAGEDYFYKVKALYEDNSKCDSAYSSAKGVWCDLARPTLTVSLNSKGKPYLKWTEAEGADAYKVYSSTDGGAWSLIYTAAGDDLDVTHTGAKSGVTYSYKVIAISNASAKANSAYSLVKSITSK